MYIQIYLCKSLYIQNNNSLASENAFRKIDAQIRNKFLIKG